MDKKSAIRSLPGHGLSTGKHRVSLPSRLGLAVGLIGAVSGIFTYGVVTGAISYVPSRTGLAAIFALNLGVALSLAGLIVWRLVRLWRARDSGRAGAKLHIRLVAMFSTIAVVPAILVAIFAVGTFHQGLEAWFSAPVKNALGSAVNVAQVYREEHKNSILADALYISNAIQHDPRLFDADKHVRPVQFFTRLNELTADRGLQASYIVDGQGNYLVSTTQQGKNHQALENPKPVKHSDLLEAQHGPVLDFEDDGTVTALVQLQSLSDAYLLVVQVVDPKVFAYNVASLEAKRKYEILSETSSEVQLVFAALYAVASLMVLMMAVWAGIWAANRLVRPISSLIAAAERVSAGNLNVQVEVERDDDEIGTLGMAFNRMTQELALQRNDLITVNRQNDERRRFTEAVLSGVSAGVIGLDHDGNITIVNRAAARLLNGTPEEIEGRHYSESVPELAALIRRAISEPAARAGGEVVIKRTGVPRALSVQVSSERGTNAHGFVATFDDITDLVSAQRTAAWADVARRIAHEIKNPLTPIQLSAERLKRKYGGEVISDPEVFQQCTDTIIRQVGDIGRMVDEFSSFARMPTPVMRRENAQELVQQAAFLQRVANPDITYKTDMPREPVYFEGDGRLVAQALTNVLKNAGEGIAARLEKGDDAPGVITVSVIPNGAALAFVITDNGVGLPPEYRYKLTEPYVTTRAKGTGLGLAIVRKIVDDHGGDIQLEDAGEGEGAVVTLTFPLVQKSLHKKGVEDEQEHVAHSV
jgi:two-component system nitrogen regulation sensor histidine kinase NtrY